MLRVPKLDDASDNFTNYAQDVSVTRYLSWAPHTVIAQTEAFLTTTLRQWENRARFDWVIEQKTDSRVIGMVGFRGADTALDVGYVLGREYWGHGVMTEALTRVVEYGLEEPEIYRVAGVCDIDNVASARVMKKSGLELRACSAVSYFILMWPRSPAIVVATPQ